MSPARLIQAGCFRCSPAQATEPYRHCQNTIVATILCCVKQHRHREHPSPVQPQPTAPNEITCCPTPSEGAALELCCCGELQRATNNRENPSCCRCRLSPLQPPPVIWVTTKPLSASVHATKPSSPAHKPRSSVGPSPAVHASPNPYDFGRRDYDSLPPPSPCRLPSPCSITMSRQAPDHM